METNNFTDTLLQALDAKGQQLDNHEMLDILENYRLLHTCVKTLFDFLLKKSLITPDPYKNEKKISDVTTPENGPFVEAERSMVMGMRLSDYDSTLDFLCNYYKFSVSNINIGRIKKLLELNNAIQWNSFSMNSNNINTRVLATMILTAKQNSDPLTANMVTDSVTKAGKAIIAINKILKEVSDYQKEFYKGNVRKSIFEHPNFNSKKAAESPADELSQIKKNFAAVMGKTPFYNELIDEIIQEDHAPNKAELQKKVLEKLKVASTENEKKEEKVDTKEMLMAAIRVFGAMPGQITLAREKIQDNHEVLESEHNSFFDKLKRALKKAFNIDEKPIFYNIVITDATSDTHHHEKLNYFQFLTDLDIRARRFASAGTKKSATYEKIYTMKEDKILEYVNNQIVECQKMLKILNGLDEFFKTAPMPQNRNRIKGLKMEITSLKNSIVKANQHRSEYSAYIEEAEQLKKLGITNV